jgi:hypothetical protein
MLRAVDIVEHGFRSYCPFCCALKWSEVEIGSRVILLTGYRCGDRAHIVEIGSDPDILICQFDGDPIEWTYREDRRHELIIPEWLYFVPDWAPPISVEDAAVLHGALLDGFAQAVEQGQAFPQRSMLQQFIVAAWRQRLPLAPEDFWPMLSAHGLAEDAKPLVIDHLSFGSEMLVRANGRSAIKRKRMRPFQSFRYEPKPRRR